MKSTIVEFFEEDLKLFVKAEIDQNATLLDNHKELVTKAIKTRAKAGL